MKFKVNIKLMMNKRKFLLAIFKRRFFCKTIGTVKERPSHDEKKKHKTQKEEDLFNLNHKAKWFISVQPGGVARLVGQLTQEPEVPSSMLPNTPTS